MILFFSDLHAKSCIYAGRPQLTGDYQYALHQIVQLAESKGCEAVIDGGDTFDTNRPGVAEVKTVQAFVDGLRERNIKYGYVLGNHCDDWATTSPQLFDWATYLQKTRMPTKCGWIQGANAGRSQEAQEMLADILPDTSMLVTHWEWRDLAKFSKGWPAASDAPGHVRLILNGHIHHQNVIEIGEGSSRYLISPGTPYLTSLGDGDDHTVTLVNDDLSFSVHPLRRRLAMRVHIDGPDDVQAVISEIRVAQQAADRTIPEPYLSWLRSPILVLSYYTDNNAAAPLQIKDAIGESARDVPGVHIFPIPRSRESEKVMERLSNKMGSTTVVLDTFLDLVINREKSPHVWEGLRFVLRGEPTEKVILNLGRACGLSEEEINSIR